MCYIWRQLHSQSVEPNLLLVVFFVVLQKVRYILRQLHRQSIVNLLVVFLVVFLVVLNMQESLIFAKTTLERMIYVPSFYPLCRTSCAALIGNAIRLV